MSRTVIEERNQRIDWRSLHPTQDHVLMRVIERTRTSGGIILPKTSATECCMGEVVAVGPGIWNNKRGGYFPLELAKGDHVLTMEWMASDKHGARLDLREGQFRLIRSYGIWAKVRFNDSACYDLAELEPRFDSLLVRLDEELMTKGGIWLANQARKEEEMRLATVVKTGPGRWNERTGSRDPVGYNPADRVLMLRYAGADVQLRGEWLRLLQEDDIKSAWED